MHTPTTNGNGAIFSKQVELGKDIRVSGIDGPSQVSVMEIMSTRLMDAGNRTEFISLRGKPTDIADLQVGYINRM